MNLRQSRLTFPLFPHTTRALSLIELLACVAIVAILATISVTAYQGALDQQDLKYAAPEVTRYLEGLRQVAATEGESVTAEFKIGTHLVHVTRKKGAQVLYEQDDDMGERGILKRNLRFLKYEWPDGASSPTTFTFTGTAAAQGGTVHFGTGHAETTIRVTTGRVVCDL